MTAVMNDEPLGKRERNKLDKRERIRDAAWGLFTTDGYDATTTKAVAKRAGVAKGTLFLYAKDKPDLLFLVFHDRLARCVDEGFASLPRKASLIDQLMHLFRRIFEMYAEHPEVAAAFVRALPGATGPNALAVHGMTFGFITRVGGLITEAQARGDVSGEVPAQLGATNVFALYFGALMGWLNGIASLEVALEQLLRPSLELQLRGFRP